MRTNGSKQEGSEYAVSDQPEGCGQDPHPIPDWIEGFVNGEQTGATQGGRSLQGCSQVDDAANQGAFCRPIEHGLRCPENERRDQGRQSQHHTSSAISGQHVKWAELAELH
jgi:hypothetical protein